MMESMSLNKDKKQSINKGFEKLLGVHLNALEDNSKSVVEILEILSQRELSHRDKEALKKVRREIKGIDSKINSLGKSPVQEDDQEWYQF